MNNLVTGGAGFVGSHLIDRLMNRGEKVVCIDNFLTGNIKNIEHWLDNKNFKLIEHDVIQPIKVNVDKIWHLACPASPLKYQLNPINTTKINFLGTYNMLGLAKRLKAKILFSSTSEVYGDPEIHPQSESYKGSVNPIGIRSCYDEGKRVSESLCYDYKRQHNVDVKVARIFNTYGPRMSPSDGRVVSNFIVQGLNKEPLTIFGDGSQTRSFCYVDDLVQGLLLLMESSHNGPINLGNPNEMSILELGKIISKKTTSKLKIIEKPLPKDDPHKRKPDIKLAKEFLNWQPSVGIDEGLNNTINYFKDINSQ
ncbi:MAG: NAD-dependent dehydratase [Cytophagia bacterium]|nr:NAD-dependent dehydratase [Cytophagia bacterium]